MEVFDTFMPKLIEIIGWQNSADKKTAAYYAKFGFRKLVPPSDCPNLTERWSTLCNLAESRYAFREINRETMEQWQISLQSRLDAVAHTFEHSYAIQKRWQATVDESPTKSTVNQHSEVHNASNSSSGKKIYVDTPDSAVNDTLRYADSVDQTTASGTSSSSWSSSDTVTDFRNLQSEMDKIIDGYRDLDILFIAKFENNFINVFY